jgi:hypothetical protein
MRHILTLVFRLRSHRTYFDRDQRGHWPIAQHQLGTSGKYRAGRYCVPHGRPAVRHLWQEMVRSSEALHAHFSKLTEIDKVLHYR